MQSKHFDLTEFHKISLSVLPEWIFFVKLHFTGEEKSIECNARSISELVEQIHKQLEQRKMSRNLFYTNFKYEHNYCRSNGLSVKRPREFSEEDENEFLKLLTTPAS